MGLLELAGQAYGTLLLLRLILPGEGQTGYNPFYRGLSRITEPVLVPLRRLLGPRAGRAAPLFALGLLLFVLGFISAGADYHRGRVLDLGPASWAFSGTAPLWWLGRALAGFGCFFYRVSSLLLILAWLWQDSISPLGRLVRTFAQRLGPARLRPPWRLAGLAAAFALFLSAFHYLAAAAGWLQPGGRPELTSAASAVWFLSDLATLFVVLIVVRVILSYFPALGRDIYSLLVGVTEPFLNPLRRLNLRVERWDLTPLAAIFLLIVGREAVRLLILRLLETTR